MKVLCHLPQRCDLAFDFGYAKPDRLQFTDPVIYLNAHQIENSESHPPLWTPKVPNRDGNIGRVDAIKLADRSTAWSYRQRAPSTSAVLPTAGGFVFSGDPDRYFKALDDATGKVLWQVRTNNMVNGFPVTYSVNGKQYIASPLATGLVPARGWRTLAPEIKNPTGGSMLSVFALPDK